MKSACPTFVETRWISTGKSLKWLKDNRICLMEHFDRKRPRYIGGLLLAIVTIQRIVERMEKMFVKLQGITPWFANNLSFCQH
jgi:hypothetical protein